MRCLIIGAGGTGKSVARGISKIKEVSKVYLMNRSYSSSLIAAKEIKSKKIEAFKEGQSINFDYVIVTLCAVSKDKMKQFMKKSKNGYESRQKELKFNLAAVKEKVPFFKKLPKKTKILLMTNPVDGIENYLKKKLPKREIFGFGLQLDVNRYSKYFGKRIVCIGIHGKTIPLVDLRKDKDYDKLYKKADRPFLKYIRKKGLPYHVYENEFKKYLKKFISRKKELIYTSARLDKSFYGIRGVSIGLPFYVKNGKVVGIKDIKLNKIEEKRLKRDVKILKNSIDGFK